MMWLKTTLTLVAFLLVGQINAQNCNNYYGDNCYMANEGFNVSNQSQNIEIEPGKSFEIIFIANAGEEYFISLCAHKKLSPIHFAIIDMNEPGKVIYDNESDNYMSTIGFENENTRKLKFVIETSVPKKEIKETNANCFGFAVEYKKM